MTLQISPARMRGLYDRPYVLFVAAALFWSGNFLLGRLVHADIPPVALAFWRWAGAAVIVNCLAWTHLRRDWAELQRRWRIVLLLSILGVAAMNTLLYAGLQSTTVVNASLIMALMPALIIVFGFIVFREDIRLLDGAGILLSMCGAYLVIGRGNLLALFDTTLNRGDLLVLLAAMVLAAYTVAMRRRPDVHPLSLMAATFSMGAILLLPLWGREVATGQFMTISRSTLLTLGYLMLFPSVVAYFCFHRCIEMIGSVRSGYCIHLVPVFSSAFGLMLLGESFAWYHAAGTLLIAGGIILNTPLARSCKRFTIKKREGIRLTSNRFRRAKIGCGTAPQRAESSLAIAVKPLESSSRMDRAYRIAVPGEEESGAVAAALKSAELKATVSTLAKVTIQGDRYSGDIEQKAPC